MHLPPNDPSVKIFQWYEGGDVLQFGNLCNSCDASLKSECRKWRENTLDGLLEKKPFWNKKCPYYVKWAHDEVSLEKLKLDELDEGMMNITQCPRCGEINLRNAIRTASEFGGRMNPRAIYISWCDCGYFKAERKEFVDDDSTCYFCGKEIKDDRCKFRGAYFHRSCFLIVRHFMILKEFMNVVDKFLATRTPLTQNESDKYLKKTLECVRALRVMGNKNVLGVNRVIHWHSKNNLPLSDLTVVKNVEDLVVKMKDILFDDAEKCITIDILEDQILLYHGTDIQWITYGSLLPVRGVEEFIERYINPLSDTAWDDLMNKNKLEKVKDGRCIFCDNLTRSHRVGSGELGVDMHVCHYCWHGKKK